MNKTIVMVVAAVCTAVVPLLVQTGPLTSADWVNVAIVGFGAGQVYIAKNLPDEPLWQYTKAIMAGLAAAGTLFASVAEGPITGSQLAQMVVAAIATGGVYLVPNPSSTPDTSPGKHEATA